MKKIFTTIPINGGAIRKALLALVFFFYWTTHAQGQCTSNIGVSHNNACSGNVIFTAISTGVSSGASSVSHIWYTSQTGSEWVGYTTATNLTTGVWRSTLTRNLSSAVTYYVATAISGCGESSTRYPISWAPTPPGSITINASPSSVICAGTSVTLTPSGCSSCTWSHNGASGAITVSPTVNTTYSISGTTSTCGNYTSSSITILVSPQVGTPGISGPSNICLSTTTNSTYTANATNASQYGWAMSPAAAGSINQTTGVVTWNQSYTGGSATITVTAYPQMSNAPCPQTASIPISITAFTGVPTPTPATVTAKYGDQVTLTASGALNGASYRWYLQGSSIGMPVNTGSLTNQSSAFTISTYIGSCELPSGQRPTQTISLYIDPPPAPTISSNTCGARTITLPAPPNGITYYWQGTTQNGRSTSTPLGANMPFTLPGSGTYYINAKITAAMSPAVWSADRSFSATVINPSPPSVPSVSSNSCGVKTLTRGNPSDGSTWYWQGTNASGTNMSSSASTYTASTTGTYYIRAYLSGCWSAATSVPVTVINPVVPSVPTVSTNSCGPKTLTRGTPGDGSTWYWQGTNATGTSQSSSASTYTANTSGTYYIRAYLSGCWSASASVAVSVTNPAAPAVPTISSNTCGPKTLTRGTPADGSTWYWQGTNAAGTDMSGLASAATYSASVSNTYYIRAYLSGCWSAATAIPLTVNSPAPPVIASLTAGTCGPRTLTKGSPPAGVTYYWQGTTVNGQDTSSPVATANTYTVTSTGIYILGARNATGCWAYNPIEVHIDAVDIVVNTYHPANSVVEATNSITLGPNFTVPAGSSFNARITISSACNDVVNWTETIVYNDAATPIGASKSYFDGLGKSLMGQTKDFLNNKVFASQPIYNTYGVPAASTFAAPILEKDFIFKNNFVRNESNAIYSASDFDLRTTTNVANSGEVNQPKPVGEQPGTLGWYYSANNNLEPNTPVTNYPYSRGYALEGPDPTISKSAGPGDSHRMGSGHEVTTERQLIATGDLTHYLSLRSHFVTSSLPVTGYKHITTDPDGKKVVSFTDGDGRGLASAILNGSAFENWSYSYYNDLGQLVARVAPNGVNTGSSALPEFVTRYYYDHLGRLIKTTSPDEGTSQFIYSTDGKIRFSQNQVQYEASPRRFSYTNYDYMGRLIESGEFTSGGYFFEPQTGPPSSSNSVLNFIDNVGNTGISRSILGQSSYIKDWTTIEYDRENLANLTHPPASFQTNLDGQIARTENANSITLYSYDEFGQVIKTWQEIKLTSPVVEKTVDYTYDYFGNVTEVAYQKDNTNDRFYHHYVYDLNQRLTEVYTSKDGVTEKLLHATYKYYLHGPLKRVELAGNLQGIDYTYTINGSLKTINHADPAKDPGGDSNDYFGETLHYFDNDYQGAGYSAGNQTLSGYNDQFSGLLKASSWHSPVDNNTKRTYAYQYDSRNQLTNAMWGSMVGTAGAYTFQSALNQNHREAVPEISSVPGYDKNGNINFLIRKGKDGNTIANYDYDYEPNTNRLDKVNHNAAQLVDYTYNSIGQMIKQDEGPSKTFNVSYNAYGLVKEVRDYNNQLLQSYFYDDRGGLLQKVTYNGSAVKYTTYISDVVGNTLAVYENTMTNLPAQPSELPVYGAGRIAMHKPAINTYFYEMNDHLGNVRAVIGLTDTETIPASMESEVSEEPPFKNIAARRVSFNPTGTNPGNEMVRMNNANPAGPGIVLKVSPGDVITLQSDAYYEAGVLRDYFVSSSSLVGTIAGIFGGVNGGVGEAGRIYSGINSGFGSLFAGGGGGSPPDPEDDDEAPYAYMTYMKFDVNMNFQYGGYKGVSTAANMAIEHLTLPSPLTIEEPGFVYVFLYNRSQSANWVYFDNLNITHQHSPIVAGGDYYPYGLPMEGREITDEPYRYGYQGPFSEKDLTTGWNEFELRMYDARFGRWTSADPYGQYASPYVGMGNNPEINIDKDGGLAGPGGGLFGRWASTTMFHHAYWIPGIFQKIGPSVITGLFREVVQSDESKNFHYFSQNEEPNAISMMLKKQNDYKVEISALMVQDEKGVNSIIIQPWDGNHKSQAPSAYKGTDYSNDGNYKQAKIKGKVYTILAMIHTHPPRGDGSYEGPSGPGNAYGGGDGDIGVHKLTGWTMFIIGATEVSKLNPNYPPRKSQWFDKDFNPRLSNRHKIFTTNELVNGDKSLFDFIK